MHRYSRQMMLPEVGEQGQSRLFGTRLLVVGAGGLGCPLLQYVVSAGVGAVSVVDHDRIELSNLPRQILFTEADLGRPKAEVVVGRLRALNSDCQLDAIVERFDVNNAQILVESVDIVVDCTDDLQTKYVLSDYCCMAKKPLVSASLRGFQAQLIVYDFPQAPCMRCIFPVSTQKHFFPTCADDGILGPVAGLVGAMQGLEVLRCALKQRGAGETQLLVIKSLEHEIVGYTLVKNPSCEFCTELSVKRSSFTK